MAKKPVIEEFLEPGYRVVKTDDESEFATKAILRNFSTFTPSQFDSDADLSRAVRSTIEQAAKKNGTSPSGLKEAHKRVIEDAGNNLARQWARDHGKSQDRTVAAVRQGIRWQASTKGLDQLDGRTIAVPASNLSADAQAAMRARDEIEGRYGNSNGKVAKEDPADQPKVPFAILNNEAKRKKYIRSQLRSAGVASGTAERMVDAGYDPLDLKGGIRKDVPVDARLLNLSRPTVNRLEAAGFTVINPKGDEKTTGGFQARELIAGRPGAAGSSTGDMRADSRRRLFTSKTVYSQDSKGNVVGTKLDPRVTAESVKRGISDRTVNSFRSNMQARKDARERKKLQDPYYRTNRVEQVVRNERLIQLEGEIRNSHGFRRSYHMARLTVMKWTMIHRGWATFVLLAAILFVPWLGVLTWTGWGLAAVGLAMFKFGALVLVNFYNLMASMIVSAINLVGNFVSGGLESLSHKVLDGYGLSDQACTGDDCERIFSYTVSKVDTTFPSWPEISKPAKFDNRTLIGSVFEFLGQYFDVFNRLNRWFRGF